MVVSKKIIHQTLACFPVLFNQFLIGVGSGWLPPTLVKLQDENSVFNITLDQISWLASISEMGKLPGTFVSAFLIDNVGRKNTLVLITFIYFVVWFSTIFAQSVHVLCLLRFTFGVANGINDVVSGIYTTENCSTNFRGIMGSMVLLIFFGSQFMEYVIATYLSIGGTAITNAIMAGCVFATLYFGTETPYFLTMKGRRDEAEKNLIWLSGSVNPEEVAQELKKIEGSIAEEKLKRQSLRLLFSSSANLKGIILVVGINMLGIAAGGAAYGTYASMIFSPSETFSTNEYTILYGLVQFIAVAISPFIIEKIDRRSLMIGCHVGITLCNTCSYFLIYSHNKGYEIAHYPWLIFGSIASFSMCGAFASPAGFALKGELLPFSVRAIGSSMGVIGFSVASFTVAKTFLPITEIFGMETNFLIYTTISLILTVFLYYVLPETRGKTLHELQNTRKNEHVILDRSVDKNVEKELFSVA